MFEFKIRSCKIGTRVLQQAGGKDILFIDVPDAKLREVGQCLLDLADAKDALARADVLGGSSE